MRKIFLGFVILIFLSCKNEHRNFYGIGEMKIDNDFENLSSAKLFEKLSENEFKIDSVKLSDRIGFVKDLILKTDDGKIYDVEFDCIKSTNISAVDSLMKDFEKYNSLNNAENNTLPIKIYQLSDGNVIFEKTIYKADNQISYRYSDIKKLLKYAK